MYIDRSINCLKSYIKNLKNVKFNIISNVAFTVYTLINLPPNNNTNKISISLLSIIEF